MRLFFIDGSTTQSITVAIAREAKRVTRPGSETVAALPRLPAAKA